MSTRLPSYPPGYREDVYYIEYTCTNCGTRQMVSIPKGKKAPRQSDEPCKYCGCKQLLK